MRFFWRTLVSETVTIARDPGALLILVGAVIVYGLVYPTPYSARVVRDVPVVVVDDDHSDMSRRLVQMVETHQATRVLQVVADVDAARRLINSGVASGVMVIPHGLSDDVLRGRPAEVMAISDATYFLLNKGVVTAITQSVATLSAGIEIRRLEARGVPGGVAQRVRAPIRVDMRPLYNPTESYTAYVVPAVYLLILHQSLLMGIGLIQGTERERAGRASSTMRLGAWRGLVSLVARTLVYVALYALHAWFYFGVMLPRLGLPGLAGAGTLAWFLAPFLLSVTGLGVALGAVFRTRESAMAIVFGLSAPLLFSTGVVWPAEAMSPWLRSLVAFVPAAPGINGLVRLTQMGAERGDVFAEWSWLWTLAFGYLLLAWIAEAVRLRAADAAPPAAA